MLTDWNFMRILRLVLGFLAIGAAVANRDVLVGGIGGLLIFQAVMNMSCGPGGCAIPTKETPAKQVEVQYEEIKK